MTPELPSAPPRPKNTHIFAKAEGLHYVEPEWVSVRLFETERFSGPVWDPFAGWGRIVEAARKAGYVVRATDIADRGYPLDETVNFLTIDRINSDVSIVGNPPFDDAILQHAIKLSPVKLALVWPFARVVAAWSWLANAPLARVLMLTPRPAMPPASYIEAGQKPEGARVEHCWLVFEREHRGPPQLGWLHRERAAIPAHTEKPVEPIVISDTAPHSPIGGSVAERVLRCPASVSLAQKVPAHLRKPSSFYADRGTALHAAMAYLLDDSQPPLESLIGKTFGSYTITSDDLENSLRPVFNHVLALLDWPNADFFLERRVIFPTIPDAFGTCDLLIRIGHTIHVLDLKFGQGVRVLALSPDGDDDVINAQLLFYAAAARNSLPAFFAEVENIVLTIVQPMTTEIDAEMVSSVTVTHAELDAFIVAYRVACEEALSDAPRLQPGSWCRFCPARPICPAHTGPLLDLAQFKPPAPWGAARAAFASPPQKEAYLQILADGLNLVDAVKDIRTAVHDQAKRALQNGDNVPGYALSAGRAERQWRDKSAVLVALQNLGFDHDDIMEAETMRSPKQVELRAKARGLKIPQELIVSNRSGVSLVRVENAHVPVPGRVELARTFSEALEAFQGGKHE